MYVFDNLRSISCSSSFESLVDFFHESIWIWDFLNQKAFITVPTVLFLVSVYIVISSWLNLRNETISKFALTFEAGSLNRPGIH